VGHGDLGHHPADDRRLDASKAPASAAGLTQERRRGPGGR
jgi:hypothetical protein